MVSLSNRQKCRNGAFTFIDLLVVLFLICFLSGVVFSAGGLMRAREVANRVKCASNLKQLAMAIIIYGNENKGNYPRTYFKIDDPTTQFTGVECKDPFDKDAAPKANDITAAMFLLLRTQDITPGIFICPSTDAQPMKFGDGKSVTDFSNFKSEDNLSYSIANVYPSTIAVTNGYRMNLTVGAEVAIMADMNPGTFGESDVTPKTGPKDEKAPAADMRKANSMNHRGAGQCVLWGDGHVDFMQNPFCGNKRDNIYTVSGSKDGSITTSQTIVGSPLWAGDSVLLPAATANPHKKTQDQEELAAARQFEPMLPKFKEELAAEEKSNPQSPRAQQMRQGIAAFEQEIAQIEARAKEKGITIPQQESKPGPDDNAAPDFLAGGKDAKIKLTKAVISGIKLAVEVYEVDNGHFPTTAEGLNALVEQPKGATNWHGPYVDLKAIKTDQWGHPYVYRCPGKIHPNGFDIISLGPDGKESDDDITD